MFSSAAIYTIFFFQENVKELEKFIFRDIFLICQFLKILYQSTKSGMDWFVVMYFGTCHSL